ncbi:hypothetical protein EJ04DRAFT_559937 [Polyplosphaeria fusca]|uniref:Uncharacterized protein n=1 Tax=Polyplosphaeria fusca TaxID=682080 RepID=A0A9P4R9G3_9PLEO|nr:hypothetical protein EJ04DRAFT_559937 [Polyplosphaeria fusca]
MAAFVSGSPILETRQSQFIGALNFDRAYETCNGREQEIIRAFRDVHLLTDAVKGISSDDSAFTDYFGTGWDSTPYLQNFLPNIELNIQKAAAILQDGVRMPTVYVTCEVLPTSCSQPRTLATTIFKNLNQYQIVFCPVLFDPSDNGVQLSHVADRVLHPATNDVSELWTWEHTALHELMHVSTAGYTTLLAVNDSPGKISDLSQRINSIEKEPRPLYGSHACHTYAQFKSPPKWAPSNADSYAWMATAKYFQNKWGTRVTRELGDEDQDIFHPGGDYLDPENFCGSQGKPENFDCASIDIQSDNDLINLDSGYACYSNGNRNWCDIYTLDTCQVTIGWDTNDGKPSFSHGDLKTIANENLGGGQCSGHVEDKQEVCAVAQGLPTALCKPAWKFCMKRVGVDCV